MQGKFFRFQFVREVLIILVLLFVYNNFLYKKKFEYKEVFIQSDGRGYYEYLPAFFIYNDIHFSYIDTLHTEFYEIEHVKPIYVQRDNGGYFNKYFVGTAVLQSPFFLVSHFIASKENSIHPADGFSLPYQRGVWYASIFYLFLGLVCIRLLLKTYQINSWWIFLTQLTLLFATPLLNYTVYDSAYSHVYSFFLISWFLYIVRRYFLSGNSRYLILSLVILGLIVIVRPVNVLVLMFTPLLTENIGEYFSKIKMLFQKHFIPFIIGMLLFERILSIQFYVSFLQTGNPLNYSYGDEGFNFSNPMLTDFLFSYHKGFFLWTPWWFLIFLAGISCWIYRKKYYHTLVFSFAFFLLVYVFSSWHAWSYGGSIGQRPMIDFYGAFVLLLVPVFLQKNKIIKWLLIICAPLSMIVMQIQTFQYQKAIIAWDGTTKELYWKVFLNTNEKYSWYFARSEFPVGEKCSEDVLLNKVSKIKNSEQQIKLPPFSIGEIDSLATIGEIRINIDREADREYMDILIEAPEGNNLFYGVFNFFHSQKGKDIICRFNLPEEKEKIRRIRLLLNRVEHPFKINSITFSTYKSLN